MVLLRVQRDANVHFALEATCATRIENVCATAVQTHNLIRRMHRVCTAAEVLIAAERRIIEAAASLISAAAHSGAVEGQSSSCESASAFAQLNCEQPENAVAPTAVSVRAVTHAEPQQLQRLQSAVQALIQLSHKDRAAERAVLRKEAGDEALQAVRAAVAAAFPGGLPEGMESLAADLEDGSGAFDARVQQGEGEDRPPPDGPLEEGQAVLWFVGKKLDGSSTVEACVGRHENTVATIKLMRTSEGRPLKEKNITPQLEDEMMAYAYKKQEIWKELEADEGLDYLDSGWADTRDLKRTLNGVGAIRLM